MDEINTLVLTAVVTVVAALLTQFALRADANRRELRNFFLDGLSKEQALSEKMAYIARRLIYQYQERSSERPKPTISEIESELFEDVWENSQLTTLGQRMEVFGIYCKDYVLQSHQLRQLLVSIGKDYSINYIDGRGDPEEAINSIRKEVMSQCEFSKRLIGRINKRFSLVGIFSNLHDGNKLKNC